MNIKFTLEVIFVTILGIGAIFAYLYAYQAFYSSGGHFFYMKMLYEGGVYDPNHPLSLYDTAFMLAVNRTKVRFIAEHVFNETTPSELSKFKHNPFKLITYLRGWMRKHLKYEAYPYPWELTIEDVFRLGYGKCVDYAAIYAGAMLYLNYSRVYIVGVPYHALAGFYYNGTIYVFDQIHGPEAIKHYIIYNNIPCEKVDIYEIYWHNGEYVVKKIYACYLIS